MPVGAGVGILSGLSLTLAVRSMRPNTMQRSILMILATSGFRWLATVLLLVAALRTSASSGLLAAGGLWLAFRATVYLAKTERRTEFRSDEE